MGRCLPQVSGSDKGLMSDKKVNALFRFKSLRATILIPFLMIVISTILIFMLISVSRSREMALGTATDYTGQLIDMANSDIDSYFSNMENIAQLILGSDDTINYLTYSEADHYKADYDNCLTRLEQQFTTLRETRDDIVNIGILGLDGNYLINDSSVTINPYAEYEKREWYRKALGGEEVIAYSHVQNLVEGEYPWVVTLSRAIVDKDTGETIGVLFIDLNYRSISSLCEKISLGSKGYVFIIDQDGRIVYHPKQQLLYSGVQTEEIDRILANGYGSFASEDGDRIYTVSKSSITGCTMAGVTDTKELMSKSDGLLSLYVLLAAILIGAASAVSVLIANMISRPIRALGVSFKRAEQENFNTRIENPGYTNVIGDLISSFNTMLARIRELIKRIQDEQTEKRKSELAALQAQINPHFLYNTLDSIIWMAESGDTGDVILMTSSLSKLLRKSISNNAEIVTVADEISYVSEYLKIQKMRYHDKLDYDIRVAPEVRSASIAKLVVQPLVENAIYHGIKQRTGGGFIRVTGNRKGDDLEITVEDNGPGMDRETLDHLMDERPENDGKKVGVRNVNRRLQLYYGSQYGLRFESRVGEGTIVRIVIPYKEGWLLTDEK